MPHDFETGLVTSIAYPVPPVITDRRVQAWPPPQSPHRPRALTYGKKRPFRCPLYPGMGVRNSYYVVLGIGDERHAPGRRWPRGAVGTGTRARERRDDSGPDVRSSSAALRRFTATRATSTCPERGRASPAITSSRSVESLLGLLSRATLWPGGTARLMPGAVGRWSVCAAARWSAAHGRTAVHHAFILPYY